MSYEEEYWETLMAAARVCEAWTEELEVQALAFDILVHEGIVH